ncbi:hypothetical protein [Nocardiopsis oceani]
MAETAPHQADQQPEGKKKREFEPCPGHVVQAFTFALDPGSETEQRLRSHCGGARTAFNWARNHVLANWGQRAAEASYGVAESERTPWRSWSLPSLRRASNAARNLAALAAQVSSTGTGVAGDRGARALKARGADRKTRTTRTRRSAGAGRAGGARPRKRTEAPAPSSGHPTPVVVTPSRTLRAETHGMLMFT